METEKPIRDKQGRFVKGIYQGVGFKKGHKLTKLRKKDYKGENNPFYGKKHPEEFKKRLSRERKGIHISPKTEFTKGRTAGEKNINWKKDGHITSINNRIRASQEYKIWRRAVYERDNYICIWCKQIGGKLNADHIKPFALYPELRFAIDNGRTLCLDCHRKTDTYGVKKK